MKKFLKYTMMMMAAMVVTSFVACSSDDDDEVKSFPLTITLNTGDVAADNISNIKIIVKGTAKADTITMNSIAQQTLTLTQGTYNITVSGKVKDEATAYVQGTATAELYAEQSVTVNLSKYNQSPLVFKAIYGAGSVSGYVLDCYVEIANNSDEVQYLDGILLADPLANQKAKSAWQETYPDKYNGGQGSVLAFPGSGKDYPLLPGQSVVVADQAMNHKLAYGEDDSKAADYAVAPDLSNADFEKYYGNGDIDNEKVPNMEVVFSNNKYMKMWAFGVMGRAYMMAKLPEGMTWQQFAADESNYSTTPGITATTQFLMIPAKYILDAVEIYNPATDPAENYPFFLPKDDTKGIHGPESYTANCVHRKVSKIENGRVYYKDTNNSGDDFKTNQPLTPGVTPTTVD